jgi:nitric oxide reductase large subunit
MTTAMWGIVIGMVLMFGVSLLRYGHNRVRASEAAGKSKNDDVTEATRL